MATLKAKALRARLAEKEAQVRSEIPTYKMNTSGPRRVVNRGVIVNEEKSRAQEVYVKPAAKERADLPELSAADQLWVKKQETTFGVPEVTKRTFTIKVESSYVEETGPTPSKANAIDHALGNFLVSTDNSKKEIKETQSYAHLRLPKAEESRRYQKIMTDPSLTEAERNAKLRRTMEKFAVSHKKGAKIKTSAQESQGVFENEMRAQGVTVGKEKPILFRVKK